MERSSDEVLANSSGSWHAPRTPTVYDVGCSVDMSRKMNEVLQRWCGCMQKQKQKGRSPGLYARESLLTPFALGTLDKKKE